MLLNTGADPTILNGNDKTAYDLSSSRAIRDAFRVARTELGEEKWDWVSAHVPAGIDKATAEARLKRDQELKKELTLSDMEAPKAPTSDITSKVKGLASKIPQIKGDAGLSPAMRMKIERERRALAAEARMKGNKN